jgi:hypothetical protein
MNKTVGTCLAVSVATLFCAACDKGQDAGSDLKQAESTTTEKSEKAAAEPAGTTNTAMGAKPPGDAVQCLGIHECKGKSACHISGGHACAGQNACKGKGWIYVPAAECTAKGGKVLDG